MVTDEECVDYARECVRSPTLARMIFCSVVMMSSKSPRRGRFATPTLRAPASACDSPWGQDTICQIKF
jgi:hypothetical protein